MTARIKDDNKKLTRRNVQLEGKDNEYRVRQACGIKSLLLFLFCYNCSVLARTGLQEANGGTDGPHAASCGGQGAQGTAHAA